MKRHILRPRSVLLVAAAMSLALLSPVASVAASAQTTQTTRVTQTQNTSDSSPTYVLYCVSAIDDAIRDADIDAILGKVFHLRKAARAYDIYATESDLLEVRYEWNNKQYLSAPFSASKAVYDILGLIPGTSPFWAIGQPATSCLEAAVVWDMQTGSNLGAQLRKDLENFLLGLTPTGLTVSADPSNGTVLRLTWHPHSMSALTLLLTSLLRPGFQVNSGPVNRNTPAGLGAVHYTWTGLQPGTEACFKVRATWALGDSAWEPNTKPSPVCARSSSPPQPTANKCVFLEPNQLNCTSSNPQITLEGENIGDTSGCTFSAQIAWGDGSQQTVKYTGANNQPEIVANHTYQQKGIFSITLNPTVLSGSCNAFSGSYKFTYS
jgi:hypothetical protein